MSVPPPQSKVLTQVLNQEPWRDRLLRQLNGNEGAGFALSLLLHMLLLALMAVPVIRALQDDQKFTTIITDPSDDTVVIEEPVNIPLPLPEANSAGGDPEAELLDLQFEPQNISDVVLSEMPKPAAPPVASGTEGLNGGKRTAAPENALEAGSFSLWPWPILGRRLDGTLAHETPGSFPKSGQSYSVVIRIRVPDDRRTVSVRDFEGTITGTDGFVQQIPQDTFYYARNGKLIPTRVRPQIPVIDGTVELIVQVPGAAAMVRDKVVIYSKLLDEEQEFELTFQPRF